MKKNIYRMIYININLIIFWFEETPLTCHYRDANSYIDTYVDRYYN